MDPIACLLGASAAVILVAWVFILDDLYVSWRFRRQIRRELDDQEQEERGRDGNDARHE